MFNCYLLQRFNVLTILALLMTDILSPVNGGLAMQQSIVKNVLAKCKTAIDKCRMTGAPCRKVSFNKDSGTCVIFDQQIPKTTNSLTTTTTTALATTTLLTNNITPNTNPLPFPNYLSIKYISQSTDQTTFTHNFNTTALTICFWMKMSLSSCGLFAIFNDPPNSNCNSHLIYSENYTIYLSTHKKNIPPKVFNHGQLYHICIAWATDKIMYYADGRSYFTMPISDNRLVGNRFILGNDVDRIKGKCIADEKSKSFVGQIAGAFMWNRFLNITEMRHQFEGTLKGSSPAVTWNQMLNFETTPTIAKENLFVGS